MYTLGWVGLGVGELGDVEDKRERDEDQKEGLRSNLKLTVGRACSHSCFQQKVPREVIFSRGVVQYQ